MLERPAKVFRHNDCGKTERRQFVARIAERRQRRRIGVNEVTLEVIHIEDVQRAFKKRLIAFLRFSERGFDTFAFADVPG